MPRSAWTAVVAVLFAVVTWLSPPSWFGKWREQLAVLAGVVLVMAVVGWALTFIPAVRQLRAGESSTHPLTILFVAGFGAAVAVVFWLFVPVQQDTEKASPQNVVTDAKPATLEVREAGFVEVDVSRGLYKVAIKMRNSGDHGLARPRMVFVAATQSLDGPPVWPVDYPHPSDIVFPGHTEFTLTTKVVPAMYDDAPRLFFYFGYAFEDAVTRKTFNGRMCFKWDGADPRSGKFDASFFATSEPEAARILEYARKRGYDVLDR